LRNCGSQILKVRNRSSATFFSPQFRNRFGCPQNCGIAEVRTKIADAHLWKWACATFLRSAIAIPHLEGRTSADAIPQLFKECWSATAIPQFRDSAIPQSCICNINRWARLLTVQSSSRTDRQAGGQTDK
jgi:hypothetical protein